MGIDEWDGWWGMLWSEWTESCVRMSQSWWVVWVIVINQCVILRVSEQGYLRGKQLSPPTRSELFSRQPTRSELFSRQNRISLLNSVFFFARSPNFFLLLDLFQTLMCRVMIPVTKNRIYTVIAKMGPNRAHVAMITRIRTIQAIMSIPKPISKRIPDQRLEWPPR